MNNLTKLFIFSVFIMCNLHCGMIGLLVDVQNNRSTPIYIVFKIRSVDEISYIVEPQTFKRIPAMLEATKRYAPPSTEFEYIKILDSDKNELYNLRGNLLDQSLKYVDESDRYICYRLDVN